MRLTPRIVLIIIALLVIAGSGGYLLLNKQQQPIVQDAPADISGKVTHENLETAAVNDVVEFEGTLTGFNDGCSYDASCVAVVDGYQIVTMTGLQPDAVPMGKSNVWSSDVGKKVKVKAKKVQPDLFAIVGAEDLYVTKIEE